MPRFIAEVQASASARFVDATPRAAKTLSLGERSARRLSRGADSVANVQPEEIPVPRSSESLLAEKAHESVSSSRSTRPLSKARREFAEAFAGVMHEHWLRGEEAYSNVAIARACGVDEKTVRQWKDDESVAPGVVGKPMPAGALRLLPSQLYGELVNAVTTARGRTPKRALIRLREAVEDLEAELAGEDPAEAVRFLAWAQGRMVDLMKKAVGDR